MIRRIDKDEALALLAAQRAADPELAACAMCRLVRPDRCELRVAESEHGIVVLDEYAATLGHLLVIARAHVEESTALSWPVFSDLARLVWEGSRAIERALSPSRIYTATLGAATDLPMSFPHHHTHIVPVYARDERARPAHVFSWSTSVSRYDPGEAEGVARRIRKAWCDGSPP